MSFLVGGGGIDNEEILGLIDGETEGLTLGETLGLIEGLTDGLMLGDTLGEGETVEEVIGGKTDGLIGLFGIVDEIGEFIARFGTIEG